MGISSAHNSKTTDLKIPLLHLLFAISYGIYTYISFSLNSSTIYLITGIVILCLYLYKIIKNPLIFFSLIIEAGHPLSYTMGLAEIPLISAFSIILCYSVSVIIFLIQSKRIAFPISKIKFLILLTGFLFLLILKLIQGQFNSIGISQLTYIFGFGYLACISVVVIIKNSRDLRASQNISVFFFMAYTIALWLLYLHNGLEGLKEIENPIGISIFLLLNIIYFYFIRFNNRLIKLILISSGIALCILIGQRSMILSIVLCLAVLLLKTPIKKYCIAVTIASVLCFPLLSNISLDEDNDKIHFTKVFLESPELYFSSIPSLSAEAAHSQLGTIGSRFFMWYLAYEHANPIYGNGLGTFANYTGNDDLDYPHNIFFEGYYLGGLPGLILLIIYCFKILKKAFRRFYSKNPYNWVVLSLFLIFGVLQFSSSLTNLFCYYIIFGYIICHVKDNNDEKQSNKKYCKHPTGYID